eukprot:3683988-Rhodomonas_salina.3
MRTLCHLRFSRNTPNARPPSSFAAADALLQTGWSNGRVEVRNVDSGEVSAYALATRCPLPAYAVAARSPLSLRTRCAISGLRLDSCLCEARLRLD